QVTLGPSSLVDAQTRATLLIARATAGECEVVVKGVQAGETRGWLLVGGVFQSDRLAQTNTDAELRLAAAGGEERTYMCVPPGSGPRIGIDRDEDGFYDSDEIDAGSDPADPSSTPGSGNAIKVVGTKLEVKNANPDVESKRKIVVVSKDAAIVAPPPGDPGDPRCGSDPSGTVKATIRVLSPTTGKSHETDLPCQNWSLVGSAAAPKGYRYRDAEQNEGTARTVTWRSSQLKATLTGQGPTTLDYDLQVGVDEAPVAARFSSAPITICLECTAYNGKNGSNGKQFLGRKLTCPAPSGCASSPSGAFVDMP